MNNSGVSELIALIDTAVQKDDVTETVNTIKADLCRLIRQGKIELPPAMTQPIEGRYARRLLHRNEELGYSIVIMTWGPCQSTPIHDHAGMWCVEGVCGGSINVQQYDLAKQDGDRFLFTKQNSYEAGVGSAGCLIPPYEYHSISNPCDRNPAVSLHIYGGDMVSCNVFVEQTDGWHLEKCRPLGFDN
jgi:predicted metal-dependent enzyme (double-stranded beta helix superfamily)